MFFVKWKIRGKGREMNTQPILGLSCCVEREESDGVSASAAFLQAQRYDMDLLEVIQIPWR